MKTISDPLMTASEQYLDRTFPHEVSGREIVANVLYRNGFTHGEQLMSLSWERPTERTTEIQISAKHDDPLAVWRERMDTAAIVLLCGGLAGMAYAIAVFR